jgi:hypothetical protein
VASGGGRAPPGDTERGIMKAVAGMLLPWYRVGMKHLFIFLIVLLLAAPALAEPPKTVIEDQAEADLLLGRHLFTSPALATANLVSTFVNFGEAKIYKKSETFYIEADHTCYQRIPRYPKEIKGGYVRITGKILKIKKNSLPLKELCQDICYHLSTQGIQKLLIVLLKRYLRFPVKLTQNTGVFSLHKVPFIMSDQKINISYVSPNFMTRQLFFQHSLMLIRLITAPAFWKMHKTYPCRSICKKISD